MIATDRGGSGLSSTAYVIIRITDVNDHTPYFTSVTNFHLRLDAKVLA